MENTNIQEIQEEKKEPEIKEMSLVGHLTDLRKAIVTSLVSIIIVTLICFSFNEPLLKLLTSPIGNIQFIFVSPAEVFVASLQMSVWFGIIIALPIILRQLFWFIAPALTNSEKKLSIPVVVAAYFLFLSGIAFAYYLLLPAGVKFLIGFSPPQIKPMLSIGKYISFASMLILGTGIVFETPVILVFLAKLKIVTGKLLRKQWRYAILVSFVTGAVITPSVDPFTQSLMAGALMFLYYISILSVEFFEWRNKSKKVDESESLSENQDTGPVSE